MQVMIINRVKNENELKICLEIRKKVFVTEQNVDKNNEIDDFDFANDTIHLISYTNNIPSGTGRMMINKEENSCFGQIGRMAILKDFRKQGIGRELMVEFHKIAENLKLDSITLHAQTHAEKFYSKLGYVSSGDIFLDENIDHIRMDKYFGKTESE